MDSNTIKKLLYVFIRRDSFSMDCDISNWIV